MPATATKAILALEDGSLFEGVSLGASGATSGEVVFNTAMTGYQEILTDPSYARQIVTLTYPHIGNTGVNEEDVESDRVWAAGLVIRDAAIQHSNWRSQSSLSEYLRGQNIVAIAEIDTRRLTRRLRDKGAMRGCILAGDTCDSVEAIAMARQAQPLKGLDLAQLVSCDRQQGWQQGEWSREQGYASSDTASEFHVVAYDFGVKSNILRMLVQRGCRVTVVPATTSAAEVLELQPDGVFLSNGPGDPEPCTYAISAIASLLSQSMPLFGICLGHQLLALACGACTIKMKFGHHGANHPVRDSASGRVLITSQNHGFAVDPDSLPEHLTVTHVSLFDGSLQGIRHRDKPAFGFQGHPEASPGPHDVAPLFDQFIAMMHASRA